MQHSDVWVVRFGFRRRQENEARLQTGSRMCLPDQFPADASPLKGDVNREVRKIGAIAEVGNGPRHAHQQPARITRRDDDIGIRKHSSDRRHVINRAPLRKSGAPQNVDELANRELGLQRVLNLCH